jgi:hypothetical protein
MGFERTDFSFLSGFLQFRNSYTRKLNQINYVIFFLATIDSKELIETD